MSSVLATVLVKEERVSEKEQSLQEFPPALRY